jgi:hypothetical protein
MKTGGGMRFKVSVPATLPACRPFAVFYATDTGFLYCNFTDFILKHCGNNMYHLVHLKESSCYLYIVFVWISEQTAIISLYSNN